MTTRRCNECTLCCRVMPVAEIGKAAGTACHQQRSKGCRVYGTSAFPRACRLWSCVWLLDDTLPLPRPDRSHYVIDAALDFIVIEGVTVEALQIWVDPRFPTAHRAPSLLAWLEARWDTHEQIALVRFDSVRSHVLLPPAVTGEGWIESRGNERSCVGPQHTPAQIHATLAQLRSRSGK